MFKTLMLSLVEGNTIISSIKITITENDQKKIFNTLLVVSGCLPLHYICLGCPPGYLMVWTVHDVHRANTHYNVMEGLYLLL
jgi:hypothetical protein